MEKEPVEKKPNEVIIPTVWENLDEIPSIYANQLLVTHAGGTQFYLIFGEAMPPIMLGKEKPPKRIRVKPVAKIVIAPEMMVRFNEAINRNLKSFLESIQLEQMPTQEENHEQE